MRMGFYFVDQEGGVHIFRKEADWLKARNIDRKKASRKIKTNNQPTNKRKAK